MSMQDRAAAEPSGLHIWAPAPVLYIVISVFLDLGFIFLPSLILFFEAEV